MPQPHVRKSIVQGTLSNNRAGMAVLLDTVKSLDYIDHEVQLHFENMSMN
jgi:HIV-1 Vpr-binding protein